MACRLCWEGAWPWLWQLSLVEAICWEGWELGAVSQQQLQQPREISPWDLKRYLGSTPPPLHHSCPLINGNSSGLFLKVNSKEEGQWTSHSPCCSKTIFIVSFLYNLLKILSPKALAFVHLSSSHLLWHRFSSLRGLYPSWAVAAALSIKTEQKTNKKDISEWPPCQSYSSLPPLWNQIKMSMGKSEEATIPELGGIFVDLLWTCVFLFSEYESSEY